MPGGTRPGIWTSFWGPQTPSKAFKRGYGLIGPVFQKKGFVARSRWNGGASDGHRGSSVCCAYDPDEKTGHCTKVVAVKVERRR